MMKVSFLRNACIVLVACTATTIGARGQAFTTLFSFGADGTRPRSALIQANDGNFYGVTQGGGSNNCQNGCGTVFKITPEGTLTTLHRFDSTDGSEPLAGLVQATDGNFYGATSKGGIYGYGTIFQITPVGTLTTLHSFDSTDGANPIAVLIQATDGNFYGTTNYGGANSGGTIFQITPSGSLTTLYNFCRETNCSDGATPIGGLVQATDGNLYGTTYEGGAHGYGTISKSPLGGADHHGQLQFH